MISISKISSISTMPKTKNVSKDDTIHMVKEKLITNARIQRYNDSEILRGVGCDLSQLKRINYVKNRT